MSPATPDFNRIFQSLMGDPQRLLAYEGIELQRNLDVKQMMALVKEEQVDVLTVLLQDHEDHDPSTGSSLRDLVEMVVVSGVFRFQKTSVLSRLWDNVNAPTFNGYIDKLPATLDTDFLALVEPKLTLPTLREDVNEMIENLRTKRTLEQHVGDGVVGMGRKL